MMDPNLFHIDWERTLEALVGIVVLAFFVERVCAVLFESRWWVRKFEDARIGKAATGPGTEDAEGVSEAKPSEASGKKMTQPAPPELLPGKKYPLKELIGFVVALLICWVWDFDALSIVLLNDKTEVLGVVLTAAIVAGGSKAAIKFFHKVLKIGSSAYEEQAKLSKLDAQA
ncbi:hypothetical protein KAW64_03580 [bacterium]|nr:hypothetical protein [bacterium]